MVPTLVWHLPRPSKSKYKGSFPLYFEENLIKLLGYPERILHPFGGRAEIGTRVDLNPLVEPDVVADAHALPFEDESFDCVVLDPPYSDEEALELYQTPKLKASKYTKEAVRVLREGGWLCVYTDKEPARPARCNHTMRIVVVLRPHHTARICGIFQKRRSGMPFYGSEEGETGYVAAARDPGMGASHGVSSTPGGGELPGVC